MKEMANESENGKNGNVNGYVKVRVPEIIKDNISWLRCWLHFDSHFVDLPVKKRAKGI